MLGTFLGAGDTAENKQKNTCPHQAYFGYFQTLYKWYHTLYKWYQTLYKWYSSFYSLLF